MNALQCQLRQEIHMTARSRGFHFDKIIMKANVRSPVGSLSVQAWCGRLSAFLMLNFDRINSLDRNHFCRALCEQIISKDDVMSRDEIIYRRREAIEMYRAFWFYKELAEHNHRVLTGRH